MSVLGFVAAAFAAVMLSPAPSLAAGGGALPAPADRATDQIAAIHDRVVARATSMGLAPIRSSAPGLVAAVGQMQYPLRTSRRDRGLKSTAISNHVDLLAGVGTKDFACGSRTYDGHGGTDIYLSPFSWRSMDRSEAKVVAALGGTIIESHDGEFDRQCEWLGNPPANYVVVRHDNGLLGYYWHLRSGTVTAKEVGARVVTGELLGYVGSSGFSTGPHLHFEIRGADGVPIEPARGVCNARLPSWTHQAATMDSAILDVLTHDAAPTQGQCFDPASTVRNHFTSGGIVYAAVYLRDQVAGSTATMQVIDPNGVVRATFSTGTPTTGFYTSSYWWNTFALGVNPTPGIWRLRATFASQSAEHAFTVIQSAGGQASVSLAVANPVRALSPGVASTFTVTVRNSATNVAIGCQLGLDRPIDATVTARAPDASVDNRIFSVPAGGQVAVALTVLPRSSFVAGAAVFPVKATCLNAPSAVSQAATGVLTLSSP